MGIRSFVKRTVKNNANIKGWTGWDSVKENGKTVSGFFKDLINTENAPISPKKQTFEEVVAQLKLSESDLQRKKTAHLSIAIVCALLGLGAIVWAIHLLIKGMFLSGLVSVALSTLMFAYAFREHFHYFQIKQKRLDCTVSEWVSGFLSRKK